MVSKIIEGRAYQLAQKVTHTARQRATRAANELKNAELNVLRGKRSGRVYRIPHTNHATYTASAPGEPPAVRTGTFRRSWRPVTKTVRSGKAVTVKPGIYTGEGSKGSGAPYPELLDKGSSGGKIKARPYSDEILKKAFPKVQAIYTEPYL